MYRDWSTYAAMVKLRLPLRILKHDISPTTDQQLSGHMELNVAESIILCNH